MTTFTNRPGALGLASVAAMTLAGSTVQAQPLYVPPSVKAQVNPANQLAASLALNQWAYNASLVGRNYNALTYGLATNPYAPYGQGFQGVSCIVNYLLEDC